jgi:hypothetical protein
MWTICCHTPSYRWSYSAHCRILAHLHYTYSSFVYRTGWQVHRYTNTVLEIPYTQVIKCSDSIHIYTSTCAPCTVVYTYRSTGTQYTTDFTHTSTCTQCTTKYTYISVCTQYPTDYTNESFHVKWTNEKTRISLILFILDRLEVPREVWKTANFHNFIWCSFSLIALWMRNFFSQTCNCEYTHKSSCNWHRSVW